MRRRAAAAATSVQGAPRRRGRAASGDMCAARWARRRSQQRRVLAEHRLLELAKRSTRLDPELAHEELPCPAEQLQCVCLPSGSVQREHQSSRGRSRSGCDATSSSSSGTMPAASPASSAAESNPRRRPAADLPTLPRRPWRTARPEIRATPVRAIDPVPDAFLRPRPLRRRPRGALGLRPRASRNDRRRARLRQLAARSRAHGSPIVPGRAPCGAARRVDLQRLRGARRRVVAPELVD